MDGHFENLFHECIPRDDVKELHFVLFRPDDAVLRPKISQGRLDKFSLDETLTLSRKILKSEC